MYPLAVRVLLQRESTLKEGPPKDRMTGDGGEGDEGDGKGVGQHSSHDKGLAYVEGLCCCPTGYMYVLQVKMKFRLKSF